MPVFDKQTLSAPSGPDGDAVTTKYRRLLRTRNRRLEYERLVDLQRRDGRSRVRTDHLEKLIKNEKRSRAVLMMSFPHWTRNTNEADVRVGRNGSRRALSASQANCLLTASAPLQSLGLATCIGASLTNPPACLIGLSTRRVNGCSIGTPR